MPKKTTNRKPQTKVTAGNVFSGVAKTVAMVPPPAWYLLGGAAAYWWLIRPVLTDISGRGRTDQQKEFDNNTGEITQAPAGDGSHSYSQPLNVLKSIADTQEAAMGDPGTNEDLLFNSLANMNGKDLQYIYTAFGKRWYDPLTSSSSGPLWPVAVQLDLFNWYIKELGSSDKQKMAQLWAKSGLTTGLAGINSPQIFKR